MKHVWIALSIALISSSAFAAKFTDIAQMKNTKLRNAQKTAESILKAEMYGDASKVVAVKYTKKPEETILNSVKQFNIARMGIWARYDSTTPSYFKNAGEIISFLMEAGRGELDKELSEESEKIAYAADMKKLGGALKAVLGMDTDTEIQLFDAAHCDEDGCWQVLNIVDITNQQVLTIRRGYTGT